MSKVPWLGPVEWLMLISVLSVMAVGLVYCFRPEPDIRKEAENRARQWAAKEHWHIDGVRCGNEEEEGYVSCMLYIRGQERPILLDCTSIYDQGTGCRLKP